MLQMALKNRFARFALTLPFLVSILSFVFFNPVSTFTISDSRKTLPSFEDFVKLVENTNINGLFGVYVPDVLALPVVQQPEGDTNYVSRDDNQATQFATASQYGNIGLLAHNYLSGKFFSNLAMGQEVRLVYGNGKVEYFVITEVLRFQALEPDSQWSSFRNLDTNEILSAGQMFARAYAGNHHVTFQTCVAANGNSSWGRLFVIATPKSLSSDQFINQLLQ
jgi:hypothetical protein